LTSSSVSFLNRMVAIESEKTGETNEKPAGCAGKTVQPADSAKNYLAMTRTISRTLLE
jgi:hypothetical protein